ncbi:MAG: phage head morphogenesis protein [Candidatus Dactylopiibacterium carminicum]|nr:MAG: phage head morphogenesis protein [Candidatus Dactylopiibacterium carminicum]
MATRDPAVLRALFGMEPEAAVKYLESKGLRVTERWQEMRDEAQARAFTVAHVARLDVLQDLRRGVLDAAREGKTLRQFSDELTPLLQSKGWWGKQVVVDSEGGAELVQLGSPHRLKTIYQTNLQSAYMAGRMQTAMEAEAFPYLQYVAIEDGRTRPSHAALNGQVFRKDDPIWHTHTPPNGFNCRCRVRPLTAGQVRREGLTVHESEGELETRTVEAGTDPRTGEVFVAEQTGIRTGSNGQGKMMWTDPGFNSSPLAGHNFDKVLLRKAQAALGDDAAYIDVQRVVTSAPRLRAWDGFVGNTFAQGTTQGQTMTLGVLPAQLAQASAASVLFVEDRLLVGAKARRHASRGDAPTRAQWEAMPRQMPAARWYRDTETGNLVAELPEGLYVIVSPAGAVDSAYRDAQAARKIRSGRWVLV